MMRCTPESCEWCEPWGASVPGKARCCKPPLPITTISGRPWRYSTVLDGPCVARDKPATMRLL